MVTCSLPEVASSTAYFIKLTTDRESSSENPVIPLILLSLKETIIKKTTMMKTAMLLLLMMIIIFNITKIQINKRPFKISSFGITESK